MMTSSMLAAAMDAADLAPPWRGLPSTPALALMSIPGGPPVPGWFFLARAARADVDDQQWLRSAIGSAWPRSGKRGRRMDGMLPQTQADGNDALLIDASHTTAQWQAALRVVQSEFAWQLEKITLSRTGLADVVELIGRSDHTMRAGDVAALCEGAPKENGHATLGRVILGHVLGSTDRSRALALRASRAAGWRGEIAVAVLPNLAVATMAELGARAHKGLGEVL